MVDNCGRGVALDVQLINYRLVGEMARQFDHNEIRRGLNHFGDSLSDRHHLSIGESSQRKVQYRFEIR